MSYLACRKLWVVELLNSTIENNFPLGMLATKFPETPNHTGHAIAMGYHQDPRVRPYNRRHHTSCFHDREKPCSNLARDFPSNYSSKLLCRQLQDCCVLDEMSLWSGCLNTCILVDGWTCWRKYATGGRV